MSVSAGVAETLAARAATSRPSRLRGLILLLAAALTLVAWAFATPVGSAPDDDFHLISTWCASPTGGGLCEPGASAESRTVPEALRGIHCYRDPEDSAACQAELDWSLTTTVDTDRGNFRGEYPPVAYAVDGLLATEDIQLSALLMRLLNAGIFLAITTALWLLLPIHRRAALAWAWLLTAVPLGVFLIASNNPSGWAITGVASAFLALVGFLETAGRRRVGLGIVFALSVLIAAGARGDAALYAGFAIVIVAVLAFEPTTRFLRLAILPAIMGLVALAFVLTSGMVGGASDGFGSGSTGSADATGDGAARPGGIALLAYNLLNLPRLWTGLLGEAGLGWLDTPLPAVVVFGAPAVAVGVGFVALSRTGARKAIALALIALVLTALPLYILQAGGHSVGQVVQPRYLLPLIVLFFAVLLLTDADKPIRLTRLQGAIAGLVLVGVHLVSLRFAISRHTVGTDAAGLSLSDGAEWWWTGVPGPDIVWIVGSLAFALVVALAVPLLTRPLVPAPQAPQAAPITPAPALPDVDPAPPIAITPESSAVTAESSAVTAES